MTTKLPAGAVGPLRSALVAQLARSGRAETLLVATERPQGAVGAEVPGVMAVPTAIHVSHLWSFPVWGVRIAPHHTEN